MPPYRPNPARYDGMTYRRCGKSGVLLPVVALGLWHNARAVDPFATARTTVRRAFDLGITHFDLANNYGPPPGSAEVTFGRILRRDLPGHRDELIVSTKAGYLMWPGPYGNWGSRKYLLASLDQSLRRMGLDYVDIFYSHRPDPEPPVEQTVRAGKLLREMGTPCLIHQMKYSMFQRVPEAGLFELLGAEGIGGIAF